MMILLEKIGAPAYKCCADTNLEASAAGLEEIKIVTVLMARNT